LSEKPRLPTGFRAPSFGGRFPPKSPLKRVKHNELPGPRLRQEHALERQNRAKVHSHLSQVFCVESPGKESPELALTELSLFDDNERRHLSLARRIILSSEDLHLPIGITQQLSEALKVLISLKSKPGTRRLTSLLSEKDLGAGLGACLKYLLFPSPANPRKTH
jgi:hypothetical protein